MDRIGPAVTECSAGDAKVGWEVSLTKPLISSALIPCKIGNF